MLIKKQLLQQFAIQCNVLLSRLNKARPTVLKASDWTIPNVKQKYSYVHQSGANKRYAFAISTIMV